MYSVCRVHGLLYVSTLCNLQYVALDFASWTDKATTESDSLRTMSEPIHIASSSQWQSVLSDNNVVVADCNEFYPLPLLLSSPTASVLPELTKPTWRMGIIVYADWCGPCKMIAPHFQRLAAEHSRPKKIAFCKVNVDSQSTVARTQGVTAMPTFMAFHKGSRVAVIKGADPGALTRMVADAVRLSDQSGSAPGRSFATTGHKLGDGAAGPSPAATPSVLAALPSLDLTSLLRALFLFVGLYLVSLFSVRWSLKRT